MPDCLFPGADTLQSFHIHNFLIFCSASKIHSNSTETTPKRLSSIIKSPEQLTIALWVKQCRRGQQLPRREGPPRSQPNFALNRATWLLSERQASANEAALSTSLRLSDWLYLPFIWLTASCSNLLVYILCSCCLTKGSNSIKVSGIWLADKSCTPQQEQTIVILIEKSIFNQHSHLVLTLLFITLYSSSYFNGKDTLSLLHFVPKFTDNKVSLTCRACNEALAEDGSCSKKDSNSSQRNGHHKERDHYGYDVNTNQTIRLGAPFHLETTVILDVNCKFAAYINVLEQSISNTCHLQMSSTGYSFLLTVSMAQCFLF